MRNFVIFSSALLTLTAGGVALATTPDTALVNQKVVKATVELPVTNSDVDTTFGINGVVPVVKATTVNGFSTGLSLGVTAVDEGSFTSVEVNPGVTVTRGLTSASAVYANLGYGFSAGTGVDRGINGTLGYLVKPSEGSVVLDFRTSYFPEEGTVTAGTSVGISF